MKAAAVRFGRVKSDLHCGVCDLEMYQGRRAKWGCDEPSDNPWLVDRCPSCHELAPDPRCDLCHGTLKVSFSTCPHKVSSRVSDVMEAALLLESGVTYHNTWKASPRSMREAILVVQGLRARWAEENDPALPPEANPPAPEAWEQ